MASSARALPALAAVAAAVLWGTTGTAQALGPEGTTPLSVGALRIAVGAIVLLSLAAGTAWSSRRLPAGPASAVAQLVGRRRLPNAAVIALGGVAVAAYQAFFFLGVSRTGVAVGTVVALGVAPVATGALGLLLTERPDRRWMLATAGAILGVTLLVLTSSEGGTPLDILGLTSAMGAGIAYAGYTVAARTLLTRGMEGMRVMALLFALGALLLTPFLVGAELSWLASGRGLMMVAWLGVAATGLSYVFFQYGLARINASTVATLSLAEPITATLLGVLVLREPLGLGAGLGIIVVLASLSLLALPRRRRPMNR